MRMSDILEAVMVFFFVLQQSVRYAHSSLCWNSQVFEASAWGVAAGEKMLHSLFLTTVTGVLRANASAFE